MLLTWFTLSSWLRLSTWFRLAVAMVYTIDMVYIADMLYTAYTVAFYMVCPVDMWTMSTGHGDEGTVREAVP